MKEVIVKMDEKVLRSLRNDYNIKGLCGALYGNMDFFVQKVLKAIDNGDKTVTFQMKDKDNEG